MKKILNNPISIAILIIIAIATLAWAVAWQDYGAFSGDIADTDDWLIRDISATPPADGTIKRLPWSSLKTQIGNGANYWVGSAQAYLSGEIVVNNETTLYSALSDVNDFLQMGEAAPQFGVNDTTQGIISIFGDNNTGGAIQRWYNAAGEDTNEEYWQLEVNGDDLNIGPLSDTDAFIFDNDGIINPSDTPGNTGYHDTDGENVFFFGMQSGTKAATEADTILQGFTNNALDTFLEYDGGADTLTTTKPFKAPVVDAGVHVRLLTASEDFTSTEPNTCQKRFIMSINSNADVEIELQTSGVCDSASGSVRKFSLWNNEDDGTGFELILDPNGTDIINVAGVGSCGAGNPAYVYDDKTPATLWGSSDSVWYLEGEFGRVSCSPE